MSNPLRTGEYTMLLVRDVFQAKYGRGDELVALFGEIAEHWRHGQHSIELRGNRTLTDASGPFFTVVTEIEVADFAAWQQFIAEEFAMPEFGDWFARMMPL
ncbi:MAG: hypothetical protein WA029_05360, partial [Anaerolineae bacterium]